MVGIALDRQSHLESIVISFPTRIAAEHTTCTDASIMALALNHQDPHLLSRLGISCLRSRIEKDLRKDIARVDNDFEKANETTDVAAIIEINKL